MKILILSYSDSEGGAAKAAFRIHNLFNKSGHQSKMFVASKKTYDEDVIQVFSKKKNEFYRYYNFFLQKAINKIIDIPINELKSLSLTKSNLVSKINNYDCDVVLLTWVCWEFLSVNDISRITKPIVWRLSDMWAFNGICHYDPDNLDPQWLAKSDFRPYLKFNKFKINLNRLLIEYKLRAWEKLNLNIVVPSDYTLNSCSNSKIGNKWDITKVPTPIGEGNFNYFDISIARKILGLLDSKKYILFVANEIDDYRKGFKYFIEALNHSYKFDDQIEGIIIGKVSNKSINSIYNCVCKLNFIGSLHDELSISLYYKACNLLVISSLVDNMPVAGIEAQFCGCPVVTFDSPGLSDLIIDNDFGFKVPMYDSIKIGEAILSIIGLDNETLKSKRVRLAKKRSELNDPSIIMSCYETIFLRAIS
jgi:glycosyltransferase involved in cell wall biosynthesis